MGWFVSAYMVVRSAFCDSVIYPFIHENLNNKVQALGRGERVKTNYMVYKKDMLYIEYIDNFSRKQDSGI